MIRWIPLVLLAISTLAFAVVGVVKTFDDRLRLTADESSQVCSAIDDVLASNQDTLDTDRATNTNVHAVLTHLPASDTTKEVDAANWRAVRGNTNAQAAHDEARKSFDKICHKTH